MTVFNTDLVDDLARQKVVIFIGAGVSASAVTRSGTRMKGWHQFLDDMRSHVPLEISVQVEELLNKKDYLLACELLQSSLQEAWVGHVATEFGQMAEPSPLHEAIVGLDQRILITTNFDKIMETCWDTRLGSGTHVPSTLSSVKESVFKLLKDHSGKYLIKIHGTVDQEDTLIFSRSEYIRLAFGNPLYSSFLDMLLLTHTFLFIGFSMDDPAITSLMEMYSLRYPSARPHYIFTPLGTPENIKIIYRRLRKLVFLEYDPSNHHEKLPQEIYDLTQQMRIRRRELAAGAISY